ncbi:hypothetical protein MB901379_00255 [Mycobacterium basiliense]|uniref:DUF5709 domain-containing protein n=1 Tax=Mycobacterium basiliense TaxID=2094119 RepID=A0A3S5CZG0_9MYCO|nr:hypothetical protein [Mycobacterium basiliense]VDM86730.1 hypothetical protein MB901379_00255 [Mycobacterium basiliense]
MAPGDLVDPANFPAEGGPGDTLNPAESTDSDVLHNADGDTVVDPPERWRAVDRFGMTAGEGRAGPSLDNRLAAEQPDTPAGSLDSEGPGRFRRDRVDGTFEEGSSLFEIVDDD